MEYFYLIYIAILYKIYNLIKIIKQHAIMWLYAVTKRKIMQTLLLFSHTFWKDSKVNRALLESAKTLSNVKIRNLSETYKDGVINAESEMALLKDPQKSSFNFRCFGLAHLRL